MDNKDKKILIIEDDANFVSILTEGLRQRGFMHVANAVDGKSGFLKAKEEMPDLILLDLILPKMRGEELLKKLRADETTHAISVLVISQISDYEKISEEMSMGIKGYLVKSDFSLENMVSQIENILSEEDKSL